MKRAALTIMCLLALAGGSAASNQGGTESPFVFGAGARDLGMGGAVTAGSTVATAAFWNSSLLARAEQYSFSGFHSQFYESDIAYQYFGAVVPTLDLGTLGLGVFRLGVNGIERRDQSNLLTGEFDDTRMLFLLAYGKTVSGYDLGVALSMDHHSVDTYAATSSPGLSLALSRRFTPGWKWLPRLTVAVNGRNLIKPGMELVDVNVKQPTALEFGLEMEVAPRAGWIQSLILAGAVRKVEDVDPAVSAGIEYNLYDLLYLRGGVRDSRLTFGAGLQYRSLSFDYALVDRDLGSLHMFTLTTSFGKSVSQRREAREQRRETTFNNTMNQRLSDRTQTAIQSLAREGRQLLDSGRYEDANSRFDRALFLARSAGLDTTEIHDLAGQARLELDRSQQAERLEAALNSAEQYAKAGDYLSARHYAGLALAEDSSSERAKGIFRQAETAMAKAAAKEKLIRTRLVEVDSLLSYGHISAAMDAVRTLRQFAIGNPGVQSAIKRVEFEHWKEKASDAFALRDFPGALAAVDSALVRFPAHEWCADLRKRIAEERVTTGSVSPAPAAVAQTPLSADLQKEVEAVNREAQKAFQEGNLQTAIAQWERVERLVPDYQSVRTYLVNAYRFVGVELYGKNQLQDAVAVWRKAASLAPGNTEIQEYIRRTENEITRLNELTYDK